MAPVKIRHGFSLGDWLEEDNPPRDYWKLKASVLRFFDHVEKEYQKRGADEPSVDYAARNESVWIAVEFETEATKEEILTDLKNSLSRWENSIKYSQQSLQTGEREIQKIIAKIKELEEQDDEL